MQIELFVMAAWLLNVREQGAALEAKREWAQAAAVYRPALEKLGKEGAADRFWLQISLAEVEFERRDYTQARWWLHDAEATLQSFPADAPERVRLLNAWGTLYLIEGNATAAERSLSKAVELSRVPADRAAALHNLAAVEMQTGRLREATLHEREALDLWRQQFGDRHHYVMKAWIGLSSIQGLRGEWRAAESSLQNALAIAETPEALANYAIVLDKLHRAKEAREVRRRFHFQTVEAAPVVNIKSLAEEKKMAVRSR